MRVCYLLISLFCWANRSIAEPDVLLSLPVQIDGVEKDITLHRGQTIQNAAVAFAQVHGLLEKNTEDQVNAIIAKLSTLLKNRLDGLQEQKKPVITVPLQLDGGSTSQLDLFEGQTLNDAISAYFTNNQITTAAQKELAPKLLEVLQKRVEIYKQEQFRQLEEKNKPQPLFSFELTLDGKPFRIQHFDGADPMEEAKAFCLNIGIKNNELFNDLVPRVADQIQQKINKYIEDSLKEVFSVPLNINEQPAVLSHYEGFSPSTSANHFLNKYRILDPKTRASYSQELEKIIKDRLLQESEKKRNPSLVFPVVVGQNSVNLEYFSGDSVELTARQFVEQQGLQSDPSFEEMVSQVSSLIKQKLLDQKPKSNPNKTEEIPENYSISIEIAGAPHKLSFSKKQQPNVVAKDFCTSKWNLIKEGLSKNNATDIDEEKEKQQCESVVSLQISETLQEKSKAAPPKEKILLFTLDINIGQGNKAALQYYQGDVAQQVAEEFCKKNSIGMDNVSTLVNAINSEIENL